LALCQCPQHHTLISSSLLFVSMYLTMLNYPFVDTSSRETRQGHQLVQTPIPERPSPRRPNQRTRRHATLGQLPPQCRIHLRLPPRRDSSILHLSLRLRRRSLRTGPGRNEAFAHGQNRRIPRQEMVPPNPLGSQPIAEKGDMP